MKNTKILTLLIILFGFLSCNDLQEELYSTYSSSDFYQNEEQLQTQTMGVYNSFRITTWEQNMYFLGTMPGRYTTSTGPLTFNNHAVYATSETENRRYGEIWKIAYESISRANTVIKYAVTSPLYKEKPALVNQYVAEAKWMRAYCYFHLVQFFGGVPIYIEPVESTDNAVLFKGRNSTQEVYNLIIEDLLFAKDNLPVKWIKTGRGRAVKSAATFLLGKVYLTSAGLPLNKTENYQKAIDVLKPLADNPSLYDVALETNWKNIFSINNEGNKEIIFAHGHFYDLAGGGILPVWTNPKGSLLGGIISGSGSEYLLAWHPDILLLFESTDVRKLDGFTYTYVDKSGKSTTYTIPDPTGAGAATRYAGRNGICSTKYIDPGATTNSGHSKDHIVYRYADVFLMLAEAYNEIGNPGSALPYLKTVRDRVKASTITSLNQIALRDIIRTEKVREFYGEMGELFDLRRWGTVEVEYQESRIRKWKYPSKPWEPKFILSPIPDTEISKNPEKLIQNPGW